MTLRKRLSRRERRRAAFPRIRTCRVCGCTDNRACEPFGCWWVSIDLCSSCSPTEETNE